MSLLTRALLNQVRLIGGLVALAAFVWAMVDSRIHGSFFEDFRVIISMIAGIPAGAAALALQVDKKSEI